ncbi:MAG: trehalose-phosphatase [Nocardioidaceae bacterium]
MDFRTPEGQQRYDDLVAAAARAVVGLDFDGVLSPIVPDPAAAVIHPDGPRTLVELAAQVRGVAVITGRPARQAITLGRFDEVGEEIAAQGNQLALLGQYGNERWSSTTREVVSPPAPEGLSELLQELPGLLSGHGAPDAFVEDKGLAVAVHTRRLPDPEAAFERLLPALSEAAARHGLGVEPGRLVIEMRAPGMHKGQALRTIREELGAEGVLFAGDDLGDVEAFKAVADLRAHGTPGLLVCSGSEEQKALVELSDVVVDGPEGVLCLLRQFARDAARQSGARP